MLKEIPKTVGEAMTRKVITASKDEKLSQFKSGMDRFHFRHLPVVEDGKVVGLVAHSDFLHASSSWLSEQAEERDEIIHQLPISKIMQKEVITIREDELLLDAAKLMWETKLGCLPVVDGDDRLVGILTEADFVKITIQVLGGGTPPPPPSNAPPPA